MTLAPNVRRDTERASGRKERFLQRGNVFGSRNCEAAHAVFLVGGFDRRGLNLIRRRTAGGNYRRREHRCDPARGGSNAMSKRRRFKQSISLKDRLANFAEEALKKASNLPPGSDREGMLKKVR
ncbi:hypothetical protein ACVWW6_008659 [Bradyrhizobium sp. USDA 3311]